MSLLKIIKYIANQMLKFITKKRLEVKLEFCIKRLGNEQPTFKTAYEVMKSLEIIKNDLKKL